MRDNTRRNRNIGTAKQGYGQDNEMSIPHPTYKDDFRFYFERLSNYKKEKRVINNHEFIFVVEDTLQDYTHACSVDDVAHIIEHLPTEDYGEMKFIIFRQPKRKEARLSSVWGRLIYFFELEKEDHPAIILEAFCIDDTLEWPRKLSVDNRLEFQRLQDDGFVFVESKKSYQSTLTKQLVRNTQLYRTLLHEFGHYVHYLTIVERPAGEDVDEWDKLKDFYHENIPSSEKEVFAHSYAQKIQKKLKKEGIIPFENKEEIL